MPAYNLTVNVADAQYLLHGEDADLSDAPYTGGNGLVWVDPAGGSAIVMTGLETGPVKVEVVVTDQAAEPALQDWDDVVEASVTFPPGGLVIYAPASMEDGHEISLPSAAQTAGHYRLRVHVAGRDQGREAGIVSIDAAGQVPERYKIIIWPQPPGPETRWKLTDQVGAQIRGQQ